MREQLFGLWQFQKPEGDAKAIAHAEIISIIKDLCNKGMPLLVISSELAEVVDYSDRIVVLRDRKKVTELQGDDISQNAIMKAIAES